MTYRDLDELEARLASLPAGPWRCMGWLSPPPGTEACERVIEFVSGAYPTVVALLARVRLLEGVFADLGCDTTPLSAAIRIAYRAGQEDMRERAVAAASHFSPRAAEDVLELAIKEHPE